MPNDYFRFKKFIIHQPNSAMKVGTDGVLLGAWASKQISGIHNILDIGSGTGVISLIMAQCSRNSKITAIEIDPLAADESKTNFCNSEWSDSLTSINISLQDFVKTVDQTSFDVIVSNPPYFINSYKNENALKAQARHSNSLPYDVLCKSVDYLLSDKGSFFAIFPYEEANIFIALASGFSLFCRNRVDVRGGAHKPVKRVMLEFRREKGDNNISELVIEKEKRGEYTSKYIEMTKEFYLKF